MSIIAQWGNFYHHTLKTCSKLSLRKWDEKMLFYVQPLLVIQNHLEATLKYCCSLKVHHERTEPTTIFTTLFYLCMWHLFTQSHIICKALKLVKHEYHSSQTSICMQYFMTTISEEFLFFIFLQHNHMIVFLSSIGKQLKFVCEDLKLLCIFWKKWGKFILNTKWANKV